MSRIDQPDILYGLGTLSREYRSLTELGIEVTHVDTSHGQSGIIAYAHPSRLTQRMAHAGYARDHATEERVTAAHSAWVKITSSGHRISLIIKGEQAS